MSEDKASADPTVADKPVEKNGVGEEEEAAQATNKPSAEEKLQTLTTEEEDGEGSKDREKKSEDLTQKLEQARQTDSVENAEEASSEKETTGGGQGEETRADEKGVDTKSVASASSRRRTESEGAAAMDSVSMKSTAGGEKAEGGEEGEKTEKSGEGNDGEDTQSQRSGKVKGETESGQEAVGAREETKEKKEGEKKTPENQEQDVQTEKDQIDRAPSAAASEGSASRKNSSRAASRTPHSRSRQSRSNSAANISQDGSAPPSRRGRRLSTNVLQDIPTLRKRQRGDGQDTDEKDNQLGREGELDTDGLPVTGSRLTLHADPLERLVGPIFRRADVNHDKKLTVEEILRIFRSPDLGLHLGKDDLNQVKRSLGLTDVSFLTFPEFIPLAQKVLMKVYQQQDPSFAEWIELVTADGDTVWFNKYTGEASFRAPEGFGTAMYGEVNLIEDVIREIFESVDSHHTGFLNKDQFVQMLQSNELGLLLTNDEVGQMASYFDIDNDGRITFEEFVPLAKQLIMMVYQRRDPSPTEWCRLNSRRSGLFWFNKRTGETRRQPPDEYMLAQQAAQETREQEISFVQKTLADLQGTQFQLEEQQRHTEEVENELAVIAEEAELTAAQLDETGQQLDAANVVIKTQEDHLEERKVQLDSANQKITSLEGKVSEMDQLKEELQRTQQELEETRSTVVLRESTIEERDQSINDLGVQMGRLTTELKSVTGTMHDHEETIAQLTEQLQHQEAMNRALEKDLLQVPIIKGELQRTETLLMQTQKHLEEKATALSSTRKTMRNVKDKNTELEQGLSVATEVRDKLHSARCEVHTLRQFVTGKTALVLQRERELEMAKRRMRDMEDKDRQRAQVLASVLERTARLQQEIKGTAHARSRSEGNTQSSEVDRPQSCPALLPLSSPEWEGPSSSFFQSRPDDSRYRSSITAHSTHGPPPPSTSRPPIRLPPVSRVASRPRTQHKPFLPITPADVKSRQKNTDMTISGPIFPTNLEPGKTLQSLSLGYALPEDTEAAADAVAAQQLRTGDRVLVRRKRMPWESESSKSTGLVKFIGRIDSEFVDHRVYVGLRLDNADGEHDGVVKGKRYFKCTSKHGLMVRITEIISVLPPKSLTYRPLLTAELTA